MKTGGIDMKLSKKATSLCALVVGAAILSTSAYADVLIGSGYNSLKNAVKTTASKLTNDVDNFTADLTVTAKIDGNIFAESKSNIKCDIAKQAKEVTETNFEHGRTSESYWYEDKKQTIHKNTENNSYSVYEKRSIGKERKLIENPFEREEAADAEKILDALVGNLQDIIQVEEAGEKRMYIGNLSSTQVPPLINAVSSVILKYSIFDEYNAKRLNVPYPKSNIYVKEAAGKAVVNEEGIIESAIASASMSAQDNNGIEHFYTLEISLEVRDINETVVTAPDLTGKEVTYAKEGSVIDEKYVGKYKNDIVESKGNTFVKQGERWLEITSVENGVIKGRYYEIYYEGYGDRAPRNFEFTSDNSSSKNDTVIQYTNEKGEKKNGLIYRAGFASLYLNLDVTIHENNGAISYSSDIDNFDGHFVRVFD